jgi:DNA transformation protein and related proteins
MPMGSSDEFVRHALEMMSAWGAVRSRRMFGGHGLYRDEVFFALIADDTLYLKVDAQTRDRFEAAGSAPFVYDGKNETITMSYWRAPDECLESPATMRDWCALAYAAALRARSARPAPGNKGKPVRARRSR